MKEKPQKPEIASEDTNSRDEVKKTLDSGRIEVVEDIIDINQLFVDTIIKMDTEGRIHIYIGDSKEPVGLRQLKINTDSEAMVRKVFDELVIQTRNVLYCYPPNISPVDILDQIDFFLISLDKDGNVLHGDALPKQSHFDADIPDIDPDNYNN